MFSSNSQERKYNGPVPNGTLHVHLRSYDLTMAAACTCPLSLQDRKVSRSSFYCSEEGCSRTHPLRPLCVLDLHFCWARPGASSQQTSTRQSKRPYVTKVRTRRKTARVFGCHLGQGRGCRAVRNPRRCCGSLSFKLALSNTWRLLKLKVNIYRFLLLS